MVVDEKINLKGHIKHQFTCLKYNTVQLYLKLGRADLCLNFSNLLREVPDIHRFPTVLMVEILF